MDLTCAKCAKNYRRVENIRACGFSSRHLEDAAVASASPSPLLHFSGDPGEVPNLIYDSRIHHFARVVRPIFLPPSPRFLAIARFETTTGSFLFSLPYCPSPSFLSLSLSLSLSVRSRATKVLSCSSRRRGPNRIAAMENSAKLNFHLVLRRRKRDAAFVWYARSSRERARGISFDCCELN